MAAAKTGRNIERLVKLNDEYAKSEGYARELQKVQGVSEWHEKQFRGNKRSSMPVHEALAAPDLRNVREASESVKAMALELAMAQQQVAKERKARLQELLLSEAVQYDQELSALGLAVSKDRD